MVHVQIWAITSFRRNLLAGLLVMTAGTGVASVDASGARYFCDAQWAAVETGECAPEPLDACIAAVGNYVEQATHYEGAWVPVFPPRNNPVCVLSSAIGDPPLRGSYRCYIDLLSPDSGEYVNYELNRPSFARDVENNGYIHPAAIESICDCPEGQIEKRGQCVVPRPCSQVGNPCDASSGNKLQIETDYRMPETGLELVRSYNSAQNGDFGLGVGWTAGFSRRFVIDGDSLLALRSQGWQVPFTREEGIWKGDPDSPYELTEESGGYVLADGAGRMERYGPDGRLLSESGGAGTATRYGYDAEGRVVSVTGAFGHGMTLAYNGEGHVSAAVLPGGRTYSYDYDGSSNLIRVTYPDGATRQYLYQDPRWPNHLTGIIDSNGSTIASFAYDEAGRAVSTRHSHTGNQDAQQHFSLAYGGAGVTIVTDPSGEQWEYRHEVILGVPRLVAKTSLSDGRSETRVYDERGNLVSRTDGEGRTTAYAYSATNQRIALTEAVGTAEERTTRYGYPSPGADLPNATASPSVATGEERKELTDYDDRMRVAAVTVQGFDPEGKAVSRKTSFEYDRAGRLVRIDGPRLDVSDVTIISYHDCASGGPCGQPATIENALGQRTTFEAYDEQGLPVRSTSPDGSVTSWEYDLRNRLTRISRTGRNGGTRSTSMSYDGEGQLVSLVKADGDAVAYRYDAAQNLQEVRDSLGNVVAYEYDEKDNRIREEIRDHVGKVVWWQQNAYDLRDRLAETNVAGSVERTVYDSTGILLSRTDPNNNPPTTYRYDGLGRLKQVVDALSNATGFDYDVNDRLNAVAATSGAVTQFEFDDLGNLLKETSPERGTSVYRYDTAGNVVAATDARGVVVAYGYDAMDRLISIDYPGAEEDVAIEYDDCDNGVGRVCRVRDRAGDTAYSYDQWGNLATETRTMMGVSYSTSYRHDALDRLLVMTYPSGRTVEYLRGATGRIEAVRTTVGDETSDVLSGRTWRADGVLLGQTFGNGVLETRSYDLKGRMEVQTLGTLDKRSHLFDRNDNLKLLIHGKGSREYAYDALDRLISDVEFGSGSLPGFEYRHDANGNRLSMISEGNERSYAYQSDSDLLTSIAGRSVLHDPAGNRTSDGAGRRSYTYNEAGRLGSFTKNGALRAEYLYDYLGRRVAKFKNGRRIVYHYDIHGHLIGESNGANGKPKRDYVWADDQPVLYAKVKLMSGGTLTEKQRTYLVADHLHTPRLGMDPAGRVVWRWDSDAFGSIRPDKDPDADGNKVVLNLRFPGQYHDSESGLHYNWNRYYDPKAGRYITSDPIGTVGGPNSFLYAGANPAAYSDPLGLFYTRGEWTSGPRLGFPSVVRLGRIRGKDRHWSLLPPQVGIEGYWFLLYSHIVGKLECEKGECGEIDTYDVRLPLLKKFGQGWGITLLPRVNMAGSGYRITSAYYEQWQPIRNAMETNALGWCYMMAIFGPAIEKTNGVLDVLISAQTDQ